MLKTEQNRLEKLKGMLDQLRCGKNVQNRQLATWLTEEEYKIFESDWESQQQIKEELKDKPDELRRYENKLHQATFNDNKAERFRKRGNKDKSHLLSWLICRHHTAQTCPFLNKPTSRII